VARLDLLDDLAELDLWRLVDHIGVIHTDHRFMGRDDEDFEIVDLREFLGFCLGSTGHS